LAELNAVLTISSLLVQKENKSPADSSSAFAGLPIPLKNTATSSAATPRWCDHFQFFIEASQTLQELGTIYKIEATIEPRACVGCQQCASFQFEFHALPT
jgi:hypothetical protein